MAKNHYQVLGVSSDCRSDEIRSAYRRLVMEHHPDRSKDPKSKAIFLAATEAYEVLGDPDCRRQYDVRLELERKLDERRSGDRRSPSTPSGRLAEIKLDVNRLSMLYSRGNFFEAEKLAISILERDRRQPIPYAVLGDVARMGGNLREAAKMYAYACQYDPKNPVFQRRYEESVNAGVPSAEVRRAPRSDAAPSVERQSQMLAPMFGLGLVLLAGIYVALAKEAPILPDLSLISTWTLGLVTMLFFSGVALGAAMSLDGLLESFSQAGRSATGGTPPWIALATISVVNFWAAAILYGLIGGIRGTFNTSTSRLLACVVAANCILSFAAEISGSISGLQVAIWGGNLVYLGAISGWMVTDALKAAR